ncbi:hypothetical protein [Actinoplanes campanulatus]
MTMSRGRIILSAVVVLLGAVALFVVSNIDAPGGSADARKLLTGVESRLRAAGSARVGFTAEIRPQVSGPKATFAGTSLIRFGETDEWDTTFSGIVADGQAPVEGRAVRAGRQTYLTSPSLTADDGRAWFAATTPAFWGNTMANPNLGLADLTVWTGFLARTPGQLALNAATEELPDVEDAEHEFRVRCTPTQDPHCPPPFGTDLDALFDEAGFPVYQAWIDDDGLIRKLEVSFSVINSGTRAADPLRPQGEYQAHLTFTLDDFGTPVTVTAPPADQVTQSRLVRRRE